jgi:beta-galactosidase
VTQDDRFITVTGRDVYYRFDREAAVFDTVRVRGTELQAPMTFTVWRAPTDNDRNIKNRWLQFHYDRVHGYGYDAAVTEKDGCVTVHSSFALVTDGMAWLAKAECDWTIAPDGALTVAMQVNRNTALPEFPRFGLNIELPAAMQQVKYLGYGPHESYIDKHRASWYGAFESTVEAMHEDYIRPQENGSHWYCTALRVAGESSSLNVAAVGEPFSFNVSRFTARQLTDAKHNYELIPCGHTVLTLDYRQDGIGSNSCGPVLEPAYRLDAPQFDWSFRLTWD